MDFSFNLDSQFPETGAAASDFPPPPSFFTSSDSGAAGSSSNLDFFGQESSSSAAAAAVMPEMSAAAPAPPVVEPAVQLGFMDTLFGGTSSETTNAQHDIPAPPGSASIPRLDTSEAIQGNVFASAMAAGLGNGTSDKETMMRQFLRQKMLGRLARWQQQGILATCLIDDHDFLNKDAIRHYTFEYVKDIFEYYKMRKDTLAYTDLIASTFRETASNIENYLVKHHDYRSIQGMTNKFEEDYDIYHDDFEEYGEMFANINLPTYVITGLRIAKTVVGVIAANAALTDKRTTPRRLRNAMAINPNLEKEYHKTYLDVVTQAMNEGGASNLAKNMAQSSAAQYEDQFARGSKRQREEMEEGDSRKRGQHLSLAERLAKREEEDRALAAMLNRQAPADGPRPPPPIDTRNVDPSAAQSQDRPPMRGLQAVEKDLTDFEQQIDVDAIFSATRNSATNLDFSLMR